MKTPIRAFPNHGDVHIVAALHRDDGFFRGLTLWLEINKAVDAGVRTFLLPAIWDGVNQRHRPPLELIFILLGERPRALKVFGRSANGARLARSSAPGSERKSSISCGSKPVKSRSKSSPRNSSSSGPRSSRSQSASSRLRLSNEPQPAHLGWGEIVGHMYGDLGEAFLTCGCAP